MDFEFSIVDDHAVVERYKGKNTKVIIPKQYNGFPVTKISDYCFANSKITSVVGESIKSVEYMAFKRCTNLTIVNLHVCTSIGDDAFYSCESLTSINLHECTSIGDDAFAFCSSLTSISLPVCTSIGYSAFSHCTNLTEITLPSCEYVGGNAFRSCLSLTSISLPACTYIGSFAFYSCLNLIKRGKYKATKIDLTCINFHYEIGKWYEENEAIICEKGFHYVENFYDIFNYYWGKLGQELRIFEVDAEEISDDHKNDSKRVCKKIKLVNEIKSYNKMFDKENDAIDKS